jgi:hypothetical protein
MFFVDLITGSAGLKYLLISFFNYLTYLKYQISNAGFDGKETWHSI